MRTVRTFVLVLALLLALATPALTHAAANASLDNTQPGWPASMLASEAQADGTVADELAFALIATLAGVALVMIVFKTNRKQR